MKLKNLCALENKQI